MDFEHPLRINYSELDEKQLLRILEDNSQTATHAVIIFNTDEDNDSIILCEKAEGVLLDTKESVVSWVAVTAAKLSRLSHVLIQANPIQQNEFIDGTETTFFPVAAMGELFQHCAKNLVSVKVVGRIHVIGLQNEYQIAMSHLAQLKHLETVVLDGAGGCSEWYATKLIRTKRFHGMKEVRDRNVPSLFVGNAISSALTFIGTLRHVTLPSNMTAEAALECLTIFSADCHCIESLKVSVRCAKKYDPSKVQSMAELYGKAVAKMTNLKAITIEWNDVGYYCFGLPVITAMLKGFQESQSLNSFVVIPPLLATEGGWQFLHKIRLYMENLVETNEALTVLRIPVPKDQDGETDTVVTRTLQLSKTGQFWLKLNSVGRKALLGNLGAINRWRGTLVEQKSDLSVVFFLLSSNLSAFLPALLPPKPSPPKKQKLSHQN